METAFPDLQVCYPLKTFALPRRCRQDVESGRLRTAAGRRDQPGVRRIPGFNGRVPRARRRHHAGSRTAAAE